jgi:5-carboxyvanillate decarboxylase
VYEALRGWDPRAAAAEIDRAATELKLNGVIINSHTGGEYPDEETYWPLLEAAEAHAAPIYIHPRSPAAPMATAFKKYGLETGIWGFQAETGLHALQLICGGVFDRFPRLRIVLGHLGEGLPYRLYRLDYMHPVRAY